MLDPLNEMRPSSRATPALSRLFIFLWKEANDADVFGAGDLSGV
jgi:hypothetical protein